MLHADVQAKAIIHFISNFIKQYIHEFVDPLTHSAIASARDDSVIVIPQGVLYIGVIKNVIARLRQQSSSDLPLLKIIRRSLDALGCRLGEG